MKTKQVLEKVITEIQGKYKYIIFENDSRISEEWVKELWEQTDDLIYQERLKEKQLRDKCGSLHNTVKGDEVLLDTTTDKVIGPVVYNAR